MKNLKKTESEVKPVPSRTAVRGKYFNQLPRGTNLIILDPALQAHFPDSEAVNRALHAFLAIHKQVRSAGSPSLLAATETGRSKAVNQ